MSFKRKRWVPSILNRTLYFVRNALKRYKIVVIVKLLCLVKIGVVYLILISYTGWIPFKLLKGSSSCVGFENQKVLHWPCSPARIARNFLVLISLQLALNSNVICNELKNWDMSGNRELRTRDNVNYIRQAFYIRNWKNLYFLSQLLIDRVESQMFATVITNTYQIVFRKLIENLKNNLGAYYSYLNLV